MKATYIAIFATSFATVRSSSTQGCINSNTVHPHILVLYHHDAYTAFLQPIKISDESPEYLAR